MVHPMSSFGLSGLHYEGNFRKFIDAAVSHFCKPTTKTERQQWSETKFGNAA